MRTKEASTVLPCACGSHGRKTEKPRPGPGLLVRLGRHEQATRSGRAMSKGLLTVPEASLFLALPSTLLFLILLIRALPAKGGVGAWVSWG
jgi:hypothetical protein